MTSYRTTLVALVGIAAVLILGLVVPEHAGDGDRKSTRLNSSHRL